MSAGVLVVQHEAICPPGRLGSWLSAAGLELDVVRPYAGEALPPKFDHDGLIVLGGTMGANDGDRHPWLDPVKRLLADAVGAGLPTLGVCLGHQLLAVACGGQVQPNPAGSTIGLRQVDLGAARGAHDDDPLLGGVPAGAVAIHWNDDVVTAVPPGGVVLASTSDGSPQVIRVGARAWGVQFHPEADVEIVSVWADRTVEAGERSRVEVDAHLTAIARAHAVLGGAWQPLAQRFAGLVLN